MSSSSKSTVTRRRIRQLSQGEYNLTQSWKGEGKVDSDEDKRSWFSNQSKVRGWEDVKGRSGAKNMSENNSELFGSPLSLSRAPSTPPIGNFSAPYCNLSPISENINY